MVTGDKEYLEIMTAKVASFEAGEITLPQLITDLRAIARMMHGSKSWSSTFTKQWAVLEEVSAVAIEEKFWTLPDDYKKLVDSAIVRLKELFSKGIDPEKDA